MSVQGVYEWFYHGTWVYLLLLCVCLLCTCTGVFINNNNNMVDKFVGVRGRGWDVSMRHEEKITGKHNFLQNLLCNCKTYTYVCNYSVAISTWLLLCDTNWLLHYNCTCTYVLWIARAWDVSMRQWPQEREVYVIEISIRKHSTNLVTRWRGWSLPCMLYM